MSGQNSVLKEGLWQGWEAHLLGLFSLPDAFLLTQTRKQRPHLYPFHLSLLEASRFHIFTLDLSLYGHLGPFYSRPSLHPLHYQ